MGWNKKENRARQRIRDQTREENTFLWETLKETDLPFPTDIILKKKKQKKKLLKHFTGMLMKLNICS